MHIAIVSPDKTWRRHIRDELSQRGFPSIWSGDDLAGCEFTPDTILLDVTDYCEQTDIQVGEFVDRNPLCEWIVFFSGQARFGDIGLLTRTACFDILAKSVNIDRVAVYILAACMRKQHAEERLNALENKTQFSQNMRKHEKPGNGGCDA